MARFLYLATVAVAIVASLVMVGFSFGFSFALIKAAAQFGASIVPHF